GRENNCLLNNDVGKRAMPVADRFESGVLRQVLVDIGVEDLIDNRGSHHQSQGDTDRKDKADGGALPPVLFFKGKELGFGKHQHISGKLRSQGALHGLSAGSLSNLDDADIKQPGLAPGEYVAEGIITGDQISIGTK